MLRNLSVWRLIPPGSVDPYPLEYLDALPFDVTDLPARRGQVCDYCFFGGPDKDVPLISAKRAREQIEQDRSAILKEPRRRTHWTFERR